MRTRTSLGVQYDGLRWKVLAEGLREHRQSVTREGVVVSGVYRLIPGTVRPHFRMIELVTRLVVLDDPLAAHGVSSGTVDDDGGAASSSSSGAYVPMTTREIQAGGNYHVNRNVRVMLNAIVPADDRVSANPSAVARLQIAF